MLREPKSHLKPGLELKRGSEVGLNFGDYIAMLDFFRRYQRYFFLVITVVIIISFSFFGTYSTLGSNTWREQIAFKAINGCEVTRSDVDEMALFLATDNEDKLLYGGAWGPNFLNDGVIRKD